jgi:hypothetical protein
MPVLLLVLIIGVVALLLLGGSVVLLLKLGVIAQYATKPEEPAAVGDYGLEQSREAGEGDE